MNTYVTNYTATPVTPLALGADLGFSMVVTSGGVTYSFSGTTPLVQTTTHDDVPFSCAPGTFDIYTLYTCAGTTSTFTGITGSVSGSGFASQPAARLTP